MLRPAPDEDPEVAVDHLRDQLAPTAPRSMSALVTRQAALESITPAVRDAENYPELLAAVASVLEDEVCREASDAATLFGMRTASQKIRRYCVDELVNFDLDRRLESDVHPDGDDRLLAALAAIVREGDVLSVRAETSRSLLPSMRHHSLPAAVAVALDQLLFVSPDDRIRRHATVLNRARGTVFERILSGNAEDVRREDARTAAVLSTHCVLDRPDASRLHAVVDRLMASPDALVEAWGTLVASTQPDEPHQGDSSRAAALVDAVHAALECGDVFGEASWILGRAADTTTPPDTRDRYVEALCTLNRGTDSDGDSHALVTLARLGNAGVLTQRHVPLLFESLSASLTTTTRLIQKSAAELVEVFLTEEVVPNAFLHYLLASLAEDATSDNTGVARGALDGISRLFEVYPHDWSLRYPAIAEALTPSARQYLLDTVETTLLTGEDEIFDVAAHALGNVANAAPDDDATVQVICDRLVETATRDTGGRRSRACAAILQVLNGQNLEASQAERFLAAHSPSELADSPAAIKSTSRILSSNAVAEALDLQAYTEALINRIPDLAPETLRAVLKVLAVVAETRRFNTAGDGIEFLSAAVDAHASRLQEERVNPPSRDELVRIIDAIPSPDSPGALSPLVDRLRNDDQNVRRTTVEVLKVATSENPLIMDGTVEGDHPLLTNELVHPLISPLIDQLTGGEAEHELRRETLVLIDQLADSDWLTDAHLDAIADLALHLLDDHPESASTLFECRDVVERLAPEDADRVFQRYVAALEPSDPDLTMIEGAQVERVDDTETPDGTFAVISMFFETERATPEAFLETVPICELGASDAPSIARYVTSINISTEEILSLLELAAERADRSLAPLARPLEEALALKGLVDRDHLTVLEFRTRLESTARFDTT